MNSERHDLSGNVPACCDGDEKGTCCPGPTAIATLTDFLLARIGEDEARAGSSTFMHAHGTHWSRRVLAECEAKRRIVERVLKVADAPLYEWAYVILEDLAAVYVGHPDPPARGRE